MRADGRVKSQELRLWEIGECSQLSAVLERAVDGLFVVATHLSRLPSDKARDAVRRRLHQRRQAVQEGSGVRVLGRERIVTFQVSAWQARHSHRNRGGAFALALTSLAGPPASLSPCELPHKGRGNSLVLVP